MFREMVSALAAGALPDQALLRKRFDLAVIKKNGVVNLPSIFWTRDSKINPRSDHLLWAALVTMDRFRIEQALLVVAREVEEKNKTLAPHRQLEVAAVVRQMFVDFFVALGDERLRRDFGRDLARLVPEWVLTPGNKGWIQQMELIFQGAAENGWGG